MPTQERLVELLEDLSRQCGQWVTYDMFTKWRDERQDLTTVERFVLTKLISEHMVESLRTNQVRLLNEDGTPIEPEDELRHWINSPDETR